MNYRLFISKKEQFQVESRSLLKELKENLKVTDIRSVQIYNIYDIFNADENDIMILKESVLAEVVTDNVYEELKLDACKYLAYEPLPGQYDQRADSANQCLSLLNHKKDVIIKSGRLVVFNSDLSAESLAKIEKFLVNPIENGIKDLSVLSLNLDTEPAAEEILDDFNDLDEKGLQQFLTSHGLAMNIEDLKHIQKYFIEEEKRIPTITEIRVLDTYWSDHCRHTTFETILENVTFTKSRFKEELEQAFNNYLQLRKTVHDNKKPMTLMDMATIGGKYLRKIGYLDDLEISDEINACSIEIDVDNDSKIERWLLMFKNETHNHPTEIEPFGGASTCIGGAIRDPLSGRSYVYQAMRITGSANILEDIDQTLNNKLPQRVISKNAALGYSSYGNQIGLATTFVEEIYDEGYKAKRMEVGAVVGAVKKDAIIRKQPAVGDLVILIGGATGRDGIGGATGSSKEHNDSSLEKCSSEVQKGNAPIERKLQRLFRNEKMSKVIKKANDFGAGGVCVAIGEIADGIYIDLDQVNLKYLGLNATEIAISESQERMAILISPQDLELVTSLVAEENLESFVVAKVTENKRLVMTYRGQKVVDIARSFIDTNGIRQHQDVEIAENNAEDPFVKVKVTDLRKQIEANLKQLNTASQIGLEQNFDSSIGRTTVLNPYGGKYQLTKQEGSVQKLPTLGFTNTCSLMTYGFDPNISKYSCYLGGSYSVVNALAKIVALGGNYETCRLTCQEYFERLNQDPKKWAKPFTALLGLIEAQEQFKTPAIGGKDSMSGTFKDISVPPTLITFAVTTENVNNIISSEFKAAGNYIYLVKHEPRANYVPNYEQLKANFSKVKQLIDQKVIVAAQTLKFGGLSEALCKMSFGNKIGIDVDTTEDLFSLSDGSLVVESNKELNEANFILLGKTTADKIVINGESFDHDDLIKINESLFESVYPKQINKVDQELPKVSYQAETRKYAAKRYDEVKVVIPVFAGTNCEYDCKKAFEKAGALVEIVVFNNTSISNIDQSIEKLSSKIAQAQILMLAGGFSYGDEPDGSGKYIASVLSNEKVSASIKTLLANDGLILGICNGFQALIKSGLLPYGDVNTVKEDSPTLFRNDINRHIAKIAYTRTASNKSPWLANCQVGDVNAIAFSHGEGRFVASLEVIKELEKNGQIATQYCDHEGNINNNDLYNINGSSYAIEGITSKDGKILGKMGHNERYEEGLFKNIVGDKLQDIFTSGVEYFKKGGK